MRKQKALGGERKCSKDDKSTAASPSSSSVTTAFFSGGSPTSGSSSTVTESAHQGSSSIDDEAELDEASTTTTTASQHQHQHQQQQPHQQECYTMDQLWNEIAAADAAASYNMDSWGIGHPTAEPPVMMPSSPVWEFCSDYSLWRIDDEEYYKKMLHAS
ncbi:hypothetical protein PR202_ga11020 [Eleusine coracana subsp. coracana]|uniref:Uncharacterized protein n=1 Tax=Eleusine coracana subsp. coracana TaxID=191504 RepID=A0AAV5C899_ELECO|nr:hypothetical protein PR202_ga11020 [Eleusine coracana subsp. coracana]